MPRAPTAGSSPRPSGGWRFRWRPWLDPARAHRSRSRAGTRLALRRGALSPTLFAAGVLREPTLVRFPPRFRGREEELARRLGAAEVRDGRIVRGVKAAWAWLKELALGAEPAETPAGGCEAGRVSQASPGSASASAGATGSRAVRRA